MMAPYTRVIGDDDDDEQTSLARFTGFLVYGKNDEAIYIESTVPMCVFDDFTALLKCFFTILHIRRYRSETHYTRREFE